VAYRVAGDEAVTGDAEFSRHYVDAVKNVTNDDIKRVAKRYLIDANLSVTVLKPKTAEAQAKKEAHNKASTPIHKIVLDNGLTLLLKEDPSVDLVAIDAVALAGTRQETPWINGISQLFSLVWTKGTKSKTDEWIAAEIERRGGSVGGFAGRNTVGLQMQMLAEDLPFALDLLADLIKNPLFSEKGIAEEKENLYVAIDQRNDSVDQNTSKLLLETLYTTHPYRLDPLGSRESLKRITRADLLNYYQRFIKPNNMVISIFGNFNTSHVAENMKRQFTVLPKGEVQVDQFKEDPPQQTRMNQLSIDKEQAMVMLAFQAPALNHKDRWPMEIVDAVLGSGLSGRLFVRVRDELGKAYTVGSNYTPGVDMGTFVLFVLTTNDKVDSVKALVRHELEDMAQNALSDEQIKSAASYLKGTFKMSLATPAALGAMSALNEIYGLGYNFHEEFDRHIDAVSKEDIRRVAAEYLNMNKAAIVTTTGQTSK
jgi:zinc protease